MSVELYLPELGEGVESGTIAKILVSVGDTIRLEQAVIEMETDKAAFEVPSSVEGVVEKLFVSVGDELKVGGKILSVSSQKMNSKATRNERESAVAETDNREQSAGHPAIEPQPAGKTLEPVAASGVEDQAGPESSAQGELQAPEVAVPAAPSVRRFAREIGIDIVTVPGSGSEGRISIDDVKLFSKKLHQQRAAGGISGTRPPEALPDFSKYGTIERKAMSKIRQKTASHLASAWNAIPHVTHFDRADISRLKELQDQYKDKAGAAGGKLTVTAMLVKIAAGALKVFPQFNASIDVAAHEIIYKHYFNIGVAVDTDRGLLVPVIRDVSCKNIIDISVELTRLSEKARDKSITLDDMRGGCFTISNLGGIGGTAFTPIVNWPEVAILGISRVRTEPVFVDGSFEPRPLMPLTLSYDHRLIDGADAARCMAWLVEAIENPLLVMLEG